MNRTITVTIPDDYGQAPFYKEKQQITYIATEELEGLLQNPFLLDMYPDQLYITEPWINGEHVLEKIYCFWKENEVHIGSYFKDRNSKQSEEGMRIAIAAFIDFIFWSNHLQVLSLNMLTKQISELRIKPINCEERMQYILSKPNHYQSFIQLQQLYTEAYKGYKKEIARNK